MRQNNYSQWTVEQPQSTDYMFQHKTMTKFTEQILGQLNNPEWIKTVEQLPKIDGQFVWIVPECRSDRVEPAQWYHTINCFAWAGGWFEIDEVLVWTDMSSYIPQTPQLKVD